MMLLRYCGILDYSPTLEYPIIDLILLQVFLKQCQHIMFVEISCPADINVFEMEDEKIMKYQPFAREVSSCCDQPVKIIPIVFGHTGIVSCHQKTFTKKLPCHGNNLFQQLQQAALLGAIAILRDINFQFGVT